MSERPVFRRDSAPPPTDRRREKGMLALLLLVGALLVLRPLWTPCPPAGTLIEVAGDVPTPGLYVLDEPTIAGAVAAAGGDVTGLPETALRPGDRVIVGPDGVRVAPPSDPLLVGLPVDVNTADATALQALPGIGERTAAAIIADRREHGMFASIDELTRVPGVGPDTVAALRPYLSVDAP